MEHSSKALRAAHTQFHLSLPVVHVMVVCSRTTTSIARNVLVRLIRLQNQLNVQLRVLAVGCIDRGTFAKLATDIASDVDIAEIDGLFEILDDTTCCDRSRFSGLELFDLSDLPGVLSMLDHPLICDCITTSELLPQRLDDWVSAGIMVATADANYIRTGTSARVQPRICTH